jgi:hypothetical protein
MPIYKVFHNGVLIRTLPSLYRLKEYIKETFSTEDLAVLALHGYDIKEGSQPNDDNP